MKIIMAAAFALNCSLVYGQFKENIPLPVASRDGVVSTQNSGLFFGFINPDNFSMRHSYSVSYTSFGSNGLALGEYTNMMNYKFADNLDLSANVSLVHSPYSSFGKDFTNQINGIYLSGVRLNYKPTENVNMILQYQARPYYYSPFDYYRSGRDFNGGWLIE